MRISGESDSGTGQGTAECAQTSTIATLACAHSDNSKKRAAMPVPVLVGARSEPVAAALARRMLAASGRDSAAGWLCEAGTDG